MIPVQPPNVSDPLSSPSSVAASRPLGAGGGGGVAQLTAITLPQKLPTLVLGEQVSARVAEQLGNNQVAVLIKSALFTLTLPAGLQIQGDNLNLKVSGLKPGLTFTLLDSDSAEDKGSSVQVELSSASRYLTQLLFASDQDETGQEGTGGNPGAAANPSGNEGLTLFSAEENASGAAGADKAGAQASGESGAAGKTLALNSTLQQTPQVAQTLKQGVANSGLFYESHLQAWDQGKMALEQLQQEPQAKIGQLLAQDSTNSHTALPELGNLVQRQLNTLETQQVPLHVFAWQGQPMQMVIQQEKTDERQGKGDQDLPVWSTHLSINLPVLGGLSARVRLVGNAVQISFDTEESAAGGLIQDNSSRLEAGLAAAGLSLATLTVKHEEETQS